MMKRFKKIGFFMLSLIFLLILVTTSVSAENTTENIYKRQFEISGADELDDLLSDDTREILRDIGIDVETYNSTKAPKTKKVLKLITDFFTDGIKAPLKTTLSIIGILLIFASFEGVATTNIGENSPSVFACFIASIVAVMPIFTLMDSVKTVVQSISNFMLGLVPVYTGVMISMGKMASAGGFSTLLLSASEVVSYLISYFFVPLSGAVLCLGICGGISPIPMISRLSGWIKKTSTWAMGIATTLFLSILSLQNSFSSVSDGLTTRTSKAMLSTAIPIMGPAIAETVNTARGCLGLLKSSIGIYAVVAIIIMALPTVIQLVLWRFSMWIVAGVAEVFGIKQVENLIRSVDFCLSVLLSAVCFITLLFIISLAISSGAG